MPLKPTPTFKPVADSMLEIPQPGIGGLNLKELEFEQEPNQSPYMLNMMYRNGAFSKRYGQEVLKDYNDTVYAVAYFDGDLIVHAGSKLYKGEDLITSGLPTKKGLFAQFYHKLYYITPAQMFEFDGENWGPIEPKIIDRFSSVKPDGSAYNVADDFNLLGTQFNIIYNGDGTTKKFDIVGDDDGKIDWNVTPTVTVDDEPTTAFTTSSTNKTVTFTTAPANGDNNVVMTFTLKSTAFKEQREHLLNSKFSIGYGNNSGSRLFLGGGGGSEVFYSYPYDPTYFPTENWTELGNTEDDITGFGLQYNILIVFKPREIYSMTSFTESQYSTSEEENWGLEGFKVQLVNASMGCDCPYSIQLINNLLTWYSSVNGVCTLVSTNILDERNVRTISRNIDKTNGMGVTGILNIQEEPYNVKSADYDGKYFLVFPTSGKCYMWDYQISPYYNNARESAPKQLDWYLFDHFFVKDFIKVDKELMYSSVHDRFKTKVIKLNSSFSDLDFNMDGEPDGINAYYMTPFLQFNAVPYLKNVKNIYVQCRGDTSSIIDMYYYTEESLFPEHEDEMIRIGGRLWKKFSWKNFQWLSVNWANTFRRKCSLKKIQMASFYFENVDTYSYGDTVLRVSENPVKGIVTSLPVKPSEGDIYILETTEEETTTYSPKGWVDGAWRDMIYETVADRDMSLTHISLQYSIVKNIK